MFTKYPLHWPGIFPRATQRTTGRQFTEHNQTEKMIETALKRFGEESGSLVTDIVISSNYQESDKLPADPGVAVYFTWEGRSFAIPCDRFDRTDSNLLAIYYVIQARRTEMRLGSLTLVRASMSGFLSLPVPMADRHWTEALGVAMKATIEQIEKAFREKAKQSHPDTGGNVIDMQVLIRAREQALKDRGQ